MATANKFLTEEYYESTIGEILVVDEETGLEMYSASLKSSNVNKTGTKTPVRAGRNNVQFLEMVGDSEYTIEVVDIQTKRDWLALKLGGILESKKVQLRAFPKNYTVGNGKSITLDHAPIGDEVPVVYDKATGASIAVTCEAGVLTITGDTKVGTIVMVGSYKYEADGEAISIPTADKGRDVSITITSPVLDSSFNEVFEKVYSFHRASLSTDFADQATAEKSENAITTSFTVLKHPDYEDLGTLAYVPSV